jgi:hypothetical protein
MGRGKVHGARITAQRRRCQAREKEAAGKRKGGGAHRGGRASVGWRGAAGTVAVDGGEAGSVVADDGALALHHRGGEVRRG